MFVVKQSPAAWLMPLAVLGVCPAHAQTAQAVLAAAPSSVPSSSDHPPSLGDVVVTSNPLGGAANEQVSPVKVIRREELEAKRAGTLGETLANEPGVAATGFGPNASRPVIRGLDGDRIKILSNGMGMLDASATSADHAVASNPIGADRIEVVRGAAALRYGGNAVGGVINVLDGRIPVDADPGVSGEVRASTQYSSRQDNLAAKVTAASESLAVTADGFTSSSGDTAIPGLARSARERADTNPRFGMPVGGEPSGRLKNSYGHTEGGSVGGAVRGEWGNAGLSVQTLRNNYGVGVFSEPDTRIGLMQDRQEFKGRLNTTGFFTTLDVSAMNSRYQHTEFNQGAPDTTFKTAGHEERLEATHRALSLWDTPLTGVLGLQTGRSTFAATNAAGANSFLPNTTTQTQALYLTEQARAGALSWSAGLRHERHQVGADDSVAALGCNGAQQKDFPLTSANAGGRYALSGGHAVSLQLSHTERAPTYQELFACGEHAATLANEYGNRELNKERANQIELGWAFEAGPTQLTANAYRQQFANYIALIADPASLTSPTADTGRGNRGRFESPDPTTGAMRFFPDYLYTPVRARFTGFEAQWRQALVAESLGLPAAYKPSIELRWDAVRAVDQTNGQPLPRIAPMRLGVSGVLGYPKGSARVDVQYSARQRQIAAAELPTDAYTMVNAYASYRIHTSAQSSTELFAKVNNLLNQEGRNPVSFLKDVVPLPGRSVTVGIKTLF